MVEPSTPLGKTKKVLIKILDLFYGMLIILVSKMYENHLYGGIS